VNDKAMQRSGFEMVAMPAGGEAGAAEDAVRAAINGVEGTACRIVVDISSMSRSALAGVFAAIWSAKGRRLEVTFCYAIAKYERPPSTYPPLVEFGSVSTFFAGAPRGANKSTALIVGLGYEAGRSIAAYNRMEPVKTWALLPIGADPKYDEGMRKANADLLRLADSISSINYDVNDPIFLYAKLRSLSLGLLRDHRLVFIPSGPKIAALMTYIVAIELFPDISVWRMSSGSLEPIFHRVPAGTGIAVQVVLN
jgi:hypothetical protein